jgi:hypothetical protein
MNIALLQAATGENIEGPVVRVPVGNYSIQKSGDAEYCGMVINNTYQQDLNGKLILSNNASIQLVARRAKDLTVQFVREK